MTSLFLRPWNLSVKQLANMHLDMDVFFPAFLELPGSDTLPVPEVNFPGSRPTLEVRESPPPSFRNKTKEDFSPKRGLGQQEKKALLAVEK